MNLAYRYPGAKPFTVEEAGIFFGRIGDAQGLERRVRSTPLLVLYAKSGLGKSSLLNAGLTPRIQKSSQLQTISIRFGAHQASDKRSPLDHCREQLQARSGLLDQIFKEEAQSLWYLLKARQLNSSKHDGALLILDQFEELFTYPAEEIKAFALQLAELLYRTIPDRFRRGLESKVNDLSEAELKKLHQPYTIRVVMAIRSDRLALLDRLKSFLPGVLDNTYELLPLRAEQAEDAILNPAYERNGFQSPVFDFEDDAVDHLIQFLSQGENQFIESYQLQILCEYIERQLVIDRGKTLIKKSDLQQPQAILEEYYWSKINAISNPNERLAARRLIEEGLVFEEEERRLNLYEGQIEKNYSVNESLLKRLVDSRLLRAEPSLRGGYTYELSHDTLVQPVLKAKAERLTRERAVQEAAERAEREAELNAERKKRARARSIAIAMSVLAVLAIVTSVFAWIQYQKAEDARTEAQLKQEVAEAALQARKELEIQKVLQDVSVLEEAQQYTIAYQLVQEALVGIDSTDTLLIDKLEQLKQRKSQ